MSIEDFRQFGCYFQYEIDYDPLNNGNLNEAAIRIWGLLYGDWTSLKPSL